MVGMGVAEGGELLDGATQIKRALGLQRRHQDSLVGAQDLGGLSHEAHPGDDQGLCLMIAAKAGHLEESPTKPPVSSASAWISGSV